MIGHPCMEREHRTSTSPLPHPRLAPTQSRPGLSLPLTARRVHQPRDLPTAYITSRSSTGEHRYPHTATNTKRATTIPPRRSHRSEPEARTVRVLRVTPAPAPSCACRCSGGGCPVEWCEELCLRWGGAWPTVVL
jgi:hypothetical protein